MPLEIIRDPQILQSRVLELKRAGKTIAVVPTMGALHAGHRTLLAEGRRQADILIATIFVNPTQFAPNEDLDRYPRTFEADAEMCREENVDFIFFPTNEGMYPKGYVTYIETEKLGATLCGLTRPTHFRGVTTVCTKLFLITQADVAIFGWKDAQQQLIIRRMVRDLNIPIKIVGVETVREPDGLALSSRNKYLTPEDRIDAVVLSRALSAARAQVLQQQETSAIKIREDIINRINEQSRGAIDYVCVVSQDTLEPIETIESGNTLIALAVWWGATRLIDNIRL